MDAAPSRPVGLAIVGLGYWGPNLLRNAWEVDGARVVVWGFGGIGQRLAAHLRALGADVVGVAQSAGERAGCPVVTPSSVPDVLPGADVLVNILPATSATAGVVDAATLALLPRKAWFVNVGRGATVDEDALRTALWDGVIAGAGSVLVFLPQILILFFFILLLEDSGYLPRAAFLLDTVMGKVGLSGRAFIPLLSSFACAIPGIMATRTITHWREFDEGGHFAAMEVPSLLIDDVRTFFRTVR